MGLYVLWLIIGHFIADFPLQTDRMHEKKKESLRGIGCHVVVHLVIYCIITFFFIIYKDITVSWDLVILILVISITHFIVDLLKEKGIKCYRRKKRNEYQQSAFQSTLYVLDQLLHIFIILHMAKMLFVENYNVMEKLIDIYLNDEKIITDVSEQLTLTFIIILVNSFVFGYFISIILKPFKPSNTVEENVVETVFKTKGNFRDLKENPQKANFISNGDDMTITKKFTLIKDSPPKIGMWIGVLERNIIVILFLMGSVRSIGFLIAMKALTRFKQFEDKSFAEFYLVGTMLSIILGVLAGYLINGLW